MSDTADKLKIEMPHVLEETNDLELVVKSVDPVKIVKAIEGEAKIKGQEDKPIKQLGYVYEEESDDTDLLLVYFNNANEDDFYIITDGTNFEHIGPNVAQKVITRHPMQDTIPGTPGKDKIAEFLGVKAAEATESETSDEDE